MGNGWTARKWLIDIRHKKDLTQEEAAELIGLSRSYYAKVESGERVPSVGMAKAIGLVWDFDWTKFYEDGEG